MIDSLTNELIRHKEEDTTRVKILNYLSFYISEGDLHKARGYAEEALAIAQKLRYTSGIGYAYLRIGHTYGDQVDNVKAIHFALLALTEFERNNNFRGRAACYTLIALSYTLSKEFDKALHYYKLAYTLGEKININELRGIYINNFGSGLANKGEYDSALVYYRKALEIWESLGDVLRIPDGYTNVGSTYERLGKYRLAHQNLFKALQLELESGDKKSIADIYHSIGNVYCKMGDYTACSVYLQKAFHLVEEIGNKRSQESLYESLITLETSRKNYQAAFQYLKDLSQLKDTLYTQGRFKQIAEIEARYETEKKEQTIKLLEKEKSIQTIWRNSLIAGVLLISIASFLIYRLQLSRARKAKQVLEIQQSLNDKLQEIDKLKSSFFANISHEFRTPLTLILAPLEEELKIRSGSGKEHLLLMKRNANRLLELVNQLLDLSKLESGKMELRVEQGDIESFLKVLTASFDSLAQHKQIQFVQNIEVASQIIWFDKDKVEKIATNLLANAFKFTPVNRTVTFLATVKKTTDKNMLMLRICDTGIGIPPEELEQVFSSFYQTRQTIDGHEGGTGLGLSLVKELVKLYGGTIVLQSEVGNGTVFSVELPIDKESFSANQIAEKSELSSTPSSFNGYDREERIQEQEELHPNGKDSILIVEDNTDLRNYMCSILEKKFIVSTSRNGEEALELALYLIPNLILSDLIMPRMDGMQLTEKLKTDERTSHIPVILLTAKSDQPSRLEGLRAGADDYLTKPFSTEELLVRITNLIEQRKKLAERFRERILVPVTTTQEISLDDKFLQKVRQVIETNMSDTYFTVEKLAEEVHLNRTQLLRKLKALIGLSPNDFIKDLRLKKAADMIRQKTDTITRIGYAVGFNDQSYFTKCFKKEFGVTPSEFSEQHTRENA